MLNWVVRLCHVTLKNPKTDWKRITFSNVPRCQQILTVFFFLFSSFFFFFFFLSAIVLVTKKRKISDGLVVIKLLFGESMKISLFAFIKISLPGNNGMDMWTVARPPFLCQHSCLLYVAEISCLQVYCRVIRVFEECETLFFSRWQTYIDKCF